MFAIFSGLAVSDPMPAREELHVLSSHFQVILMQRNSTFAVFGYWSRQAQQCQPRWQPLADHC